MRHTRRPPRGACKRYSSGLRFPSSVKSFCPSHTPPAGEEAGEASQPQFRSHRRDGRRCSSTEPGATAPLLSTGPPVELQLVVKRVSRASLPSTAVPRDRSVVPRGPTHSPVQATALSGSEALRRSAALHGSGSGPGQHPSRPDRPPPKVSTEAGCY
ncbi:hypothetical protein NDU88_000929 [Pleurodeles waltl]|uniref:Uncharacterized protein n=1 Tax=Pleurodeles waltl TaxID=8319 RepID=A0AAV7VXZ8_PLEWA|nr:hypothetical protein NDU88_000929 [Pleurodeles waltl]